MTLRKALEEAEVNGKALGHFNVSETAALKGIVEAALELEVPVMIGVSEGEREFFGVHQIAAIVRSLRSEYHFPVYLNADHTHSLQKAEIAAVAGFDEVLFDGSRYKFDENVRQTKQAVEAVKSINPDILVEGEIGYIGSSSEILEHVPEGAALSPKSFTTPLEAKQFVEETKIDILAPAVGNMHGLLAEMVKGKVKKHLDISRIREIKSATGIFMTLHGGSGTDDHDFIEAVKAGITIIHVNTELRLAWRLGVEQALKKNLYEVAPYKILPEAVSAIKKVVMERLKLFNMIPTG